jgi:hypothetical protein
MILLATVLFAWSQASDGVNTIEVIPKESWGQPTTKDKCRTQEIRYISIHHSATMVTDNRKVPNNLRNYQRYHQKQGWMDIAYHFAIDRNGNVYQGRDIDCAGDTFTKYDPSGHLLIMLDGNFEKQEPTKESLESLTKMVSWAAQQYQVDAKDIHYHKQMAATACPGESLIKYIDSGELLKNFKEPQKINVLDLEQGRIRVNQVQQEE